jgi:hypothetical protein
LDKKTYKASSTVSGAFNRQPDQIKALSDDPENLGKSIVQKKEKTSTSVHACPKNETSGISQCTFVKMAEMTVESMLGISDLVSSLSLMDQATGRKRQVLRFLPTDDLCTCCFRHLRLSGSFGEPMVETSHLPLLTSNIMLVKHLHKENLCLSSPDFVCIGQLSISILH